MGKELEIKFFIENKYSFRNELVSNNFNLIKKEFLVKRKTFSSEKIGKWLRVRDEGDKITLTFKEIGNNAKEGFEDITVIVDDFEKMCKLINKTNFVESSYQENFREQWQNEEISIAIDTWPCLPSYIELKSYDLDIIKKYTKIFNLDFDKESFFGSVNILYNHVYNIPQEDFIEIPLIIFNDDKFEQLLNNYKNQE